MPGSAPALFPAPKTFARIRATRAHEQIFDQLQQGILSGEIAAGSRLPSERSLMTEFQVSRPTIREALRIAEYVGLITVRQGDPGGPVVVGRPSAGVAHIFDGLLRADRTALIDLLEIRMVLEGTAALLASERSARQHTALRGAYQTMETATELADFVEADAGFHYKLAEISGNRLLPLILDSLREPILRLIAAGLARGEQEERRERALASHRKILAAIVKRNGAAACRAVREHLFETYAASMTPKEAARARKTLEL